MGPSGSGKTTLLNLLGGLDVPTSGSITVAGDEITRMSAGKLTAWRARHVGFIFQMYNLIPVLTAFQNVELPLLLTRLSKAERRKHVETALDSWASPTAWATIRASSPAARSSGWPSPGPSSPTRPSSCATSPRATSTARAPTRSWSIIDRLVSEHGKTVLMVTHDPRAAERAHVVLHLDKGVLVEAAGRRRRMKFFRLVWANLRRKKVRTTLTIGSFAVALFLFGLLAAIRVGFRGGADAAGADRLDVINRVSLILPLPLSYRDRMLQVPGVASVTYATWFGGVYQDERNFFPQFAVDKDTWFDVYPEYVVSPEEQWRRS